MKPTRKKWATALLVGWAVLALGNSLKACPSCAGAVPWDDGVEGEAEGLAYNRTIGFMLAAPAFLVCAFALASRKNQRPSFSGRDWD